MKTQTFLSTLPFAGFYESYHDDELDREIENAVSEIKNDCLARALVEFAYGYAADFGAARLDYAKAYAAAFLDWLSLDGAFESMESPRFYNYETDRIFVTLTRDDLARLWGMVSKDDFAAACEARFTSRSGFISHYSPDWKDWGPLSSWDHNQIGTLIGVAAETEQGSNWSQISELELMEGYLCNGGVHNAMWQGKSADRFWRIANYLTERANKGGFSYA